MFDFITVGTATQDVFLKSKEFKHLRDPEHLKKIGFKTGEAECFALGSKIELEDFHITFGGGAANAGITFARQGFKTGALVRVGDDEIGTAVINNLKKEKIIPIAVKDKKNKTAYSSILLLPTGERTILIHRGASADLKKNEVKITKLKAKWAYIAPGNIPFATISWMINFFKRSDIRVAMNPSRYYLKMDLKKLRPIFNSLDIVIVNREEASYLTGADYENEQAIFRKFDKIIDGIAVMTEGSRGALVSDGRYIYRSGVYKEGKIVDRTGAGDAFGSGFVAGIAMKNDINYALKLGSANATSVVEQVGAQTGILSKKDLQARRFKYLDLDIEPLL